jgi:hypothetical protein
MRLYEIEYWALQVIARVESGQPNEDARVELKALWPDDHAKAARQIAAHANAAHGSPILWLIGVDQGAGTVVGAKHEEMSSWYPQVESYFDGLAPRVTDINVPAKAGAVVALLFDTDRAPFVVKVAGADRLEVPWRGSSSTRSARREELLRLLVPAQQTPDCEVLGGRLTAEHGNYGKDTSTWEWSL